MRKSNIGEIGSEVVEFRYSTSEKSAKQGWMFTTCEKTTGSESYSSFGRMIEFDDGSISVVIGEIESPDCKVVSYSSWDEVFSKLVD